LAVAQAKNIIDKPLPVCFISQYMRHELDGVNLGESAVLASDAPGHSRDKCSKERETGAVDSAS
jgi:hypothetical protein